MNPCFLNKISKELSQILCSSDNMNLVSLQGPSNQIKVDTQFSVDMIYDLEWNGNMGWAITRGANGFI